jgi:AraC-like DNA-binding protein
MIRHFERQTFNGNDVGLPELEMFGWTSTPRATDLGLKPHTHKGAYEICLIVGGSVQWWVEHEIYQLGRGAIYITRPDEPHGGIDEVMHPCALYWLILPLPGKQPLPGLTLQQTRELMRRLAQIKQRTFMSSPSLEQCFKQLHAELQNHSPLRSISSRACLHRLLVQLLRDHDTSLSKSDSNARSATMRQAMQWIADHMTDDATVEEMAAAVHLGVSRFHERFLAEVGLTPADYRTHLRIRRAQHLLQHTDQSVTRISFDLGFSTSQYFATVFKKIVGMPPGSFRQVKRRG